MPTNGLKWGESPVELHPPSPPVELTARRLTRAQERARRVEAFRSAVASGTYRVDSFMVADRLLDHRVLERDDV